MTDTASMEGTNIVFKDENHEKFYYEKLAQVEYTNCYHKALIYILGISEDTRSHFNQIFDMKSESIKTGCLRQGWQTSGSIKAIRLAFNLYTDGMPGVTDYEDSYKQISECRNYSVSDIFCSIDAAYFWEGIKLRYPKYCQKQETIEEIPVGMK